MTKKIKQLAEHRQHEELLHALNEMVNVSRFFRAYCYRAVIEQGFSINEIDVLVSLKQNPTKNTVKGISEEMHLSKGIISQAVESLRKKKMITVNHSQKDRRSVLIHLSQVAHPVLDRLRESSNAFMQRIVEGLSKEQIEQVSQAVSTIYHNQEQMRQESEDFLPASKKEEGAAI